MNNEELQNILSEHFKKKGDLPILHDTVAPLLVAVEAKHSDASDIAGIILKDQGFTTKVLKMVNSVYYNPANTEITTISRSVVLLGLEKIRSIALKLAFVTMFQKHHLGINLNNLVANSLISATLAHEIAEHLNHPSPEKVSVHSLLFNLGTITAAYYMPDNYIRIENIARDENLSPNEAQVKIIGFSYNNIAVALATKWEFPKAVIETLTHANNISLKSVAPPDKQHWICARLSNEIADNLSNHSGSSKEFLQILKDMETSLEIKPEEVLRLIERSYKKIKGIVIPFELKPDGFKPLALHGYQSKTIRDRLVKKIQELFSNNEESGKQIETMKTGDDDSLRDTLKIKLLKETSNIISEGDDISLLFDTVLESIHRGVGFDRAFLAILTSDRTRITGRYSIGRDSVELFKNIDIPNKPDENVFAKSLTLKQPLLIQDIDSDEFSGLIPDKLKNILGARSFVISPIYSAKESIGFIYADKTPSGCAITKEDYQSFLQFGIQANIGFEKMSLTSPVQAKFSFYDT